MKLTNKSNGMGLGIGAGAAMGIVLGLLAGHVALWLGIGAAIGIAIGSTLRRKENDCPQCAALHQRHEATTFSHQPRS